MQPSISLRLSDYPQKDREQIWRSFNSGVFDIQPNLDLPQGIDTNHRLYRLGMSVLGTYSHTGNTVRSVSTRSAMQREELLILRMYKSGSAAGVLGDRSYRADTSQILFYDYHQTVQAANHPGTFVSFTFPYSAIGFDPSLQRQLLQIPAGSPAGFIIQSNLEMMLEVLPEASLEEAGALADGFSGLLKGLLSGDLRDDTAYQSFIAARNVSVRRYVSNNLQNPYLSTASICKETGVSRATLHRIFKPEGGVKAAVTRKRLEGALNELAGLDAKRGVIAQVARRWTFFDQAHFSRLFRSTFGITPTDALGSAIESDQPTRFEWREPVEDTKAKVPLRSLYEVATGSD